MKQCSLLDVARMLLNSSLEEDIKIDSVILKIKYRGRKGAECIYIEKLGNTDKD